MKKTRICDILKIRYPVLQGGMLWLADANLAAAVSSAGALGVISPYAGMPRNGDPLDNLKSQIEKVGEMTKKPFGVNIPLDLRQSGLLLDICLTEGVKIVITAAGNPVQYTKLLQEEGATVMHVVSSVKQAKKAQECGVDAIIVEGVESAGHIGFDELPLFSLIPQVVDNVNIPVIAAGGIVDVRGVVAAFSLGAQGVQMGTRFVAVDENIAHKNYKDAIIKAQDSDTVVTSRKVVPTRSLKTEFSMRLMEMERSGSSEKDISDFIGYRRSFTCQLEGKLDKGEAFAGTSAGMIDDIVPASVVIQRLVEGYSAAVDMLVRNES